MKQKWLEMIQVTVWVHTDHLFWFGFTKNKTGTKTAPVLFRRTGATT